MSTKRMEFPLEVKLGSFRVKIYRVRNKSYRVTNENNTVKETERFSYTVSYFAGGKRRQQMFADFDEAYAEAKSKANALSRGELDVLELRAVDALAYVNAEDLLNPSACRWKWP